MLILVCQLPLQKQTTNQFCSVWQLLIKLCLLLQTMPIISETQMLHNALSNTQLLIQASNLLTNNWQSWFTFKMDKYKLINPNLLLEELMIYIWKQILQDKVRLYTNQFKSGIYVCQLLFQKQTTHQFHSGWQLLIKLCRLLQTMPVISETQMLHYALFNTQLLTQIMQNLTKKWEIWLAFRMDKFK